MKLHGYYRSTASWRVRIALHLKKLNYEDVFHHLRRGEQRAPGFLDVNPQGLVPAIEFVDGLVLTQSLAICEYIDEIAPRPPLLPLEAADRARVRAFSQVIACDTHPLQNLRVLQRLRDAGLAESSVTGWAAEAIDDGLSACAALIAERPGPFCFGKAATLADICLIPQLANARRFGVDLRWPRLLEIEAACQQIEAFRAAEPFNQPDAEAA
jgi:maleylpyruvate isomerase